MMQKAKEHNYATIINPTSRDDWLLLLSILTLTLITTNFTLLLYYL